MTQAAAAQLDGNAPAPPPSDAPLDQRVETLLEEAERAAHQSSDMPSPDAEPSPESSLDEAIDSALDEARQRLDQVAAAATDVQSLDDVLSTTAAERIEMAEEPLDPRPRESSAPEPVTESSPAASEREPSAQADLSASSSPHSAEESPEIGLPHPQRAESRKLNTLIAALAWPMSLFPPIARDVIGWFGLVTLFNGACLWLYVLMS